MLSLPERLWCSVCGKRLDHEYWLIDGQPFCKEHMRAMCQVAIPRDNPPEVTHVWSIVDG